MESNTRNVYTLLSKDNMVWKRSSSGGAFTEICKAWDNGDCVFVGATWNGLEVQHTCVESIDRIPLLCKSKYIGSKMGDVFSEVKSYLEDGKRVVFCGTPCQIAGLKLYLGKEYSKLLLIDLICHGVGSQKVFMACINQMSRELGGQIIKYDFRAKRNTFETEYMTKVDVKSGSSNKSIYLKNDRYMQLFLKQNALRKSCSGNCCFRNEKRPGDITISDAKGLLEIYPELIGCKKNYSSIVINTSKGEKVVPYLSNTCHLLKSSIENVKKYNPLFFRHTYATEDRDLFFDEFKSDPEQAILNWTTPAKPKKNSLLRFVYNILPVRIRKLIQLTKRSIIGWKKRVEEY